MSIAKDPSSVKVAAVLGRTVKFYGRANDAGFRSFISSEEHKTYGHALMRAKTFDEAQMSGAKVIES